MVIVVIGGKERPGITNVQGFYRRAEGWSGSRLGASEFAVEANFRQ